LGSAYRDVDGMAQVIKESVLRHINTLSALSIEDMLELRYERIMSMGAHDIF
jgi:acetyl-CoA carboxylase alpha subunit